MVVRKKADNHFIQGSLFEEDYLVRTLGSIVSSPETALTELVANAWDAGATNVKILIPDDLGKKIIIEDDGTGLTKNQFYDRWMRLAYNRLKHQGKEVVFPPKIEGKRLAYGRNGVGRHGLLCFNNEYKVITHSSGETATFVITTTNRDQPFIIKRESFCNSTKHGTRLEVTVTKHLPEPDRILEILSAKFLHDPKFLVLINKKSISLEHLAGLIDSREIMVEKIKLTAHFIDSQKAGRSTIYQGVAFWQNNRLVGEPSWYWGHSLIFDGRTKFAKRYTVVVKSDDLSDFVLEDWSGFKKCNEMENVYEKVSVYVTEILSKLAEEGVEDTKRQVKCEFAKEYSSLSPLGKYELNEAIDSITRLHPLAKPESLSLAVEAIINLEKTRTGKELLLKLTQLTEDEIEGLNELIEKWSIRDALSVLDEIDNRLSVIEAIRKLATDKATDELHVLHPLVTSARWLFGPEFESVEFSSNRQLQTTVERVFKKEIQREIFNNHKNRPDIVVLSKSTISVTGTEKFDPESQLSTVDRVLIIELKKGGSELNREERNQAQGYVEDFMNCGSLIGNPYIEAFVVGNTYSEKIQPISTVRNSNSVEMGKIRITTFGQLVDTAERRLFGLRKKLDSRYENITGMELFKQQATQLGIDYENRAYKHQIHGKA
ncbi:MAG: ATP-binding protein [Candidatus Riflebacteria bacterium HGW-Riflebacteria-1]|jgi:hypothetical protein|nr:MAG: ATP-binding protein [Candidatus Riflebacteria bacterium HGW-Riflebacteria-1]